MFSYIYCSTARVRRTGQRTRCAGSVPWRPFTTSGYRAVGKALLRTKSTEGNAVLFIFVLKVAVAVAARAPFPRLGRRP